MNAMRLSNRSSVVFGVVLMIASCASLPDSEDANPASDTPDLSAAGTDSFGLSALPPRTLARGECGLFVWKADVGRNFTLFAGKGDMASALIDGKETNISRTSGSGTKREGQTAFQEFSVTSRPETSVKLRLSSVEVIESGTRYKSGVLTITDPDDWEQVIPVVGFSTCQA